MNASDFYDAFGEGFDSMNLPDFARKLAGTPLRWKASISSGALRWKASTNPRSAGLLELGLWPGEFRFEFQWQNGRGRSGVLTPLSVFELTDDSAVAQYGRLQISALREFLATHKPDNPVQLNRRLTDLESKPKPLPNEWCMFSSSASAKGWGLWYGKAMEKWLTDSWAVKAG